MAKRKSKVGRVVSNAMDKTAVVAVETFRKHPLYRKNVRRITRYKIHDENNDCGVGDVVKMVETRPLSREKRWRLVEIVTRGLVVEVRPEEIEPKPEELAPRPQVVAEAEVVEPAPEPEVVAEAEVVEPAPEPEVVAEAEVVEPAPEPEVVAEAVVVTDETGPAEPAEEDAEAAGKNASEEDEQ